MQNRKYCLQCSPRGKHNTRALDRNPITEKTCPGCNSTLSKQEFYSRRKDEPSSYCKKCSIRITIEAVDKLKDFALNYLGGCCSECGYSVCKAAMEFHHKKPSDKKIEVAALMRRKPTQEKLLIEIVKCKILCANCHRKEHAKTEIGRNAQRYREIKQQCVAYKGGACLVCGVCDDIRILDFHHLDVSKKEFSISKTTRSFDAKKKELDKCILVCANHHREIHAGYHPEILASSK